MITAYPLIPGSPFLLDHLLGLLFVSHVAFMNYLVAAPLLTVWYLWVNPEEGRATARWLAAPLPVMFTFAITFGVASLLIVQVLFGERFFTANIVLGKYWLSTIALLVAAFYGAYLLHTRVKRDEGGRWSGGLVGLAITAMVWAIAVVMVSNYFVTTDDERWARLLGQPWAVLEQATFAPRTLHFLTGSFAVAGFWMFWISQWRERRGAAEAAVRLFRRRGLWLATAATGVQISVGVWLLIWSPVEVWNYLFSGTFLSMVWISAVAAGLLMLGLLIVASVFPDRLIWGRVATGLLAWTLLGMVAGRDAVRQISFDPDFSLRALPSSPQPVAMALFLVLSAAGILVLLWLGWLVWRLPPTEVHPK